MKSDYWDQYKWHEKGLYHFYKLLLNVAYLLRLRKPFNSLQRWLKGEHKMKKTKIPFDQLLTPAGIVFYTHSRFKYREDSLGTISVRLGGSRVRKRLVIPLDYVSDPEVFHTFLLDKGRRDGDCDDYHLFVAVCLARLKEVQEVYLASCGYRGGGHTFCYFRMDNLWYLVDYTLRAVNSEGDIPHIVAERHSKSPVVLFFVKETVRGTPWRAKQIGLK